MLIHGLVLGMFQSNCYIVVDEARREAVVIDPGDEAETILQAIADLGVQVKLIIATHAHLDHVMAVSAVKEATGAPFLMHQGDATLLAMLPQIGRMWLGQTLPPAPPVDHWLTPGETVGLHTIPFRVLFTPGHSMGSVSLYWRQPAGQPVLVRVTGMGVRRPWERDIVFSGDALFAGSIGRTDLGGDMDMLLGSIRRELLTLPDDTLVLSGHGGPTTVGQERQSNPFVGADAEW